MSRDIYYNYLENSLEDKENHENKPERLDVRSLTVSNNDEQLKVLKEISQKLDSSFSNSYESIDLAIINGRVVIPDEGVIDTNIYIKDGRIISLGDLNFPSVKEIIDAKGKYVIPGVFDPHVHLGIFTDFNDELVSETKAAIAGGVTTIGCYFNSNESHFNTFPEKMERIEKDSYVDIVPHFVLNSEIHRKEMQDYINHLGVTSFKVYLNGIPGIIPDVEDDYILDVMEEIKKSNKKCILCSHTENRHIVNRATKKVMEEKGDLATLEDWSDTHPDIAEEEASIRMAYWAKKIEVAVYLVHISTALSINSLREIKKHNPYVNIETTSPYLSISKTESNNFANKMVPPFRGINDIDQLWKGFEDNTIDTVGTDNVPITKNEKNLNGRIWDVLPGYSALETHLPILLHEGVIKRGLDIDKVISKITKNPAKIFNVFPRKGTIKVGSDADIVIVDMNIRKKVLGLNLISKSDFSPFENREIQGWPVTTIKGGKLVYNNGQFISSEKNGSCVMR